MTQLLFFDTFSHDLPEELNLDLVQFPRTVIVEEVRVIPLGARVDVGGMGSRLGATNPNRFSLDFFVNDLMNPSASVFANLGSLPYDNNGQIFLDTRTKKIPTDGLLLRGHYSAITLAIYGIFSSASAAQYAPAPAAAPEYEHQATKGPIKQPHQQQQKQQAQPLTPASTEKRWPPQMQMGGPTWSSTPMPEAVVQSRQMEEPPPSKHSSWMLENGSRDTNTHDYHGGNHHNYQQQHHHHSSQHHHYRRSQERSSERKRRSPPVREYRSRTKSPALVSRSSRRSVTPKSPPNNGHVSPTSSSYQQQQHRSRRSISSEKVAAVQATTEDVAPVLDDVSDISDGDIGVDDEENDSMDQMEVVDEVTEDVVDKSENGEEKSKDPAAVGAAAAFISEHQKLSDEDCSGAEVLYAGKQLIDIPEDIEEISEDEADWSDDGDCFFADMLDYDIDFGTDWVDPIKVFDIDHAASTNLPTRLQYLTFEPTNDKDRTFDNLKNNLAANIMPNVEAETLIKLKELNENEFVGSDWVELVESVSEVDLQDSSNVEEGLLEPIVRRCISITDAMRHQIHTFKVRHLKSGLKFAVAALRVEQAWTKSNLKNVVVQLIELLKDDSVTVPLKLMALNAMHCVLDHPCGREVLTQQDQGTVSWTSRLIDITLEQKLTTRLKISIATLLERINLHEAVLSLNQATKKNVISSYHDVQAVLQQILNYVEKDGFPKLTFLSNVKCGVVSYVYRDLLKLDFILALFEAVNHHHSTKNQEDISISVVKFLSKLIQNRQGLVLLATNPRAAEELLVLARKKILECNSSSRCSSRSNDAEFVLHCLHIMHKLDILFQKCRHKKACEEDDDQDVFCRTDLETIDVLEALQDLYGMTFNAVGRSAIVHVLSMSDFLKPIIRLVKHSCDFTENDKNDQQHPQPQPQLLLEDEQSGGGTVAAGGVLKRDMKKSAIRGYACELLLLVVRTSNEVEYLCHFADELLVIGKSDETSKLHELTSWLSILEEDKSLKIWDKTGPRPKVAMASMEFFCEIIKKHIDSISPMSCELAMAVRHLYKIIVGQHNSFATREALIRAFALNFCDHAVTILNKACGYHEQPHLHTATFAGYNGYLLLATIMPIVHIMKKIFDFLVLTQDDGFRDVLAINALLKTFTLCTVVSGQFAYNISLDICSDIIGILQSYTTISVDMSQDRKTSWQLMLQELVKYIVTSPHTYISGLKLLNELLPLPLSWTVTNHDFTENAAGGHPVDVGQEKQRNMWSAQLYGISYLKEMIMTLLPCRTRQVKSLLFTVCHQLADLSAPIAIIVAEAAITSLKKNPEPMAIPVATLLTRDSIKAAFLSLLKEKYKDLLVSLSKEVVSILTEPLMNPYICLVSSKFTNVDASTKKEEDEGEVNVNSLPDWDNALHLLDAFITCDYHQNNSTINTNASSGTTISRTFTTLLINLTPNSYGLSLIRTTFLRHKFEVCNLLKMLNLEELSSIEKSLMNIYRVTSLEDWRDLFSYTAPSDSTLSEQQQEHSSSSKSGSEFWLEQEDNRIKNSGIAKRLMSTLENEQHKCEEHDLQWPQPHNLLEQFSKRETRARNASVEVETIIQDFQKREEDAAASVGVVGDPAFAVDQASSTPATHNQIVVDLLDLIQNNLSSEFDLEQQVKHVCDEKSLEKNQKQRKKPPKSLLEAKALVNKHLIINFKAGGNVIKGSRSVFNRGQRPDLFRSRPKNTSRPPSLHVDDYMALEARGQQPTGPTGYNKQSVKAAQELFAEKEAKSKGSIVGFREATKEPVYEKSNVAGPHSAPGGGGGGSGGGSSSGNKGGRGGGIDRTRGNDRTGKPNFRGSSRTFNNRDRHSPSGARDYGNRENRSSGGPGGGGRPPNDRRFNNPRRNNDSRRGGGGGKDRYKGKGRGGDGSRSSIGR